MPTKFNFDQEDLFCWYCHVTYENKKELEIHSFIHSACGEDIVPVFNLIKVNKNSKIQDAHGKFGKDSTDLQVDTDRTSDAVNELSLLENNVEDGIVKSCDNGYTTSDSVNELNLIKHNVEDGIVESCSNGYTILDTVGDLNLLKDNVEQGFVKSCDNGYIKLDAVSDLNLLKHNVEDGVVKSCDNCYTISDGVNEMNFLKNNVEDGSVKSSDSGYSSPVHISLKSL